MNRGLSKTFIDKKYSSLFKKKYPSTKIFFNYINEIWSIVLADFSDYKISNNKGFRYIFIISDNFTNYTYAIPQKIKNSQTLTNFFSSILIESKRSSGKSESNM